jgi:hypothetical protein
MNYWMWAVSRNWNDLANTSPFALNHRLCGQNAGRMWSGKKQAHVQFIQRSSNSGEWNKLKKMPDQWTMKYVLPDGSEIVFRFRTNSI